MNEDTHMSAGDRDDASDDGSDEHENGEEHSGADSSGQNNSGQDSSDQESDNSEDDGPKPSGTREDPPPSAVVWAARLITAALMAAIIGYLLYLVMRDPVPVSFDIDPDFSAMRDTNAGCVLPVSLTNTSTSAVGAVTLTAENEPDGDTPELLSTTFALMGRGETKAAELVFGRCPDAPTLDLRVTSYQSP